MKKRKFINEEVKRMQIIAGIIKEDDYMSETSPLEEGSRMTITNAFKKAGVDLASPCVTVNSDGDPGEEHSSAQEVLTDLEESRARYEEEDPNFNEYEGMAYEFPGRNVKQGQGLLLGDSDPACEGKTFKLAVTFGDEFMVEVWQESSLSQNTTEAVAKPAGKGITSQVLQSQEKKGVKVKRVAFPNGLEFEVGGDDTEGGRIFLILKLKDGYSVSSYEHGEGYTYYYDLKGNEVD